MASITVSQAGINVAIGLAKEYNKSIRLDDRGNVLRSSDRRRRRDGQLSYLRTLSPKTVKHTEYSDDYQPKHKKRKLCDSNPMQVEPYEICMIGCKIKIQENVHF